MDWKIELVFIPVSDIDRARDFYVNIGFVLDCDQQVEEGLRFVQLTPPGSACSIALGEGITEMTPGTQNSIQVVIPNADDALAHLNSQGVDVHGVDEQAWGRFVRFNDPDGNTWTLQELPDYSKDPYAPQN